MGRAIRIDPVTRIEGHAKVLVNIGDDGKVASAGMVVNELRGFERILVGMEADSMPLVTGRICGVCPSAHHLAAAKALDAAVGVDPPPAAKLLRELLYMGHYIHSHALSLFVLEGPDLVLGIDGDPAKRNVVGVVEAVPDVAKKAIRLRTLGQKINEMVGGRGIHPVTGVAGGITFQLTDEKKRILEKWTDEALALVQELAPVAKKLFVALMESKPALFKELTIPTWSVGTCKNGALDFYDGVIRAMDAAGQVQVEFETAEYVKYLSESTLKWSYMKLVHLLFGGKKHLYRVGTLARINAADSISTPLAQAGLGPLRKTYGRPAHQTMLYTYARVIELVYACERASQIIRDPEIRGETRIPVKFRDARGVGHVEAPRGTLIHDYEIDSRGIVRSANLIIATQQNYAAINKAIAQTASAFVSQSNDQAMLNAIEHTIRVHDPCLSCATHAVGQMPLEIEVIEGGEVVRRIGRGSDASD